MQLIICIIVHNLYISLSIIYIYIYIYIIIPAVGVAGGRVLGLGCTGDGLIRHDQFAHTLVKRHFLSEAVIHIYVYK